MKAFPTTKPLDSWGDPNQGMDLRDYFAAHALNSMGHFYMNAIDNETIANKCYEIADAMMKAREQ
jgi:hypothetical protein